MNAGQSRATGSMRNICGKAAAVGFACGVLLGQAEAFAACDNATRANKSPDRQTVVAHTVVRNSAKTVYNVTISRGGVEKQSGNIGPGGQLAKLSGIQQQGDFNVTVSKHYGDLSTSCSYRIVRGSISATDWQLTRTDGMPCGGNIKIACTRTYHPEKARWNTLFDIQG